MFFSLAPDLLGIQTDLSGALELAARHGFAGVDSSAAQLASLSPAQIEAVQHQFASLKLRAGYFNIGTVISAPEDAWQKAVERLQIAAPTAQKLGYTRATAVVLPFSETLPFEENFAFHRARLGEITPILERYGVALGIEYVAPLTRRAPFPHPFIHDLRGALELLDAVGRPNLGLLLDSFHWFCAGEGAADIAALSPSQIVVVHLNDAIAGRPRDEQVAFERELPGQSGEIDLAAFLAALQSTGYDGPLTCEPMNQKLNAAGADEAAAQTIRALQNTFAA